MSEYTIGAQLEGTWIKCVLVNKKPKTDVWMIQTQETNTLLGYIKWFPQWRKYAFFPEPHTVYEALCLEDIARFTRKLTEAHKNVTNS